MTKRIRKKRKTDRIGQKIIRFLNDANKMRACKLFLFGFVVVIGLVVLINSLSTPF